MWNKFRHLFSNDIGIDLGTANTLVYARDRGILREPSVVAVAAKTRRVLAVGMEAKRMLGRTPGGIIAIRPMGQGVIQDPDITQELLADCIEKSKKILHTIRPPRVVVAVPGDISQVERTAVKEATKNAGARKVYMIEEPMAAAIGVGLPVAEPAASMIVDIGGGTTDIALISLAGIVYSRSVRVGGDEMDRSIVEHMKERYNLLIGERTAEDIKIKIGSAYKLEQEITYEVKGRDLVKGRPVTLEITSQEIREEALDGVITEIVSSVQRCLENAPPELAGDLVDRGMMLAGGGALLTGIDRKIAEATQLPVHIADDPLSAVAEGAGRVLDQSVFANIAASESQDGR